MNVALGAVQVAAELPGRLRVAVCVQHVHVHPPLPYAQRRLQRFDHTRALRIRHAQAVLHHFQPVLRPCMDARVALAFQQLQDFVCGKIFRDVDREGDDQPRVARLRCARL